MTTTTRADRVQAFLFVVIGLAVTATVVFTLLDLPFGRKTRTYYLRFTDSVGALEVDAQVKYKGVKYGRIKAIAVDPADPEVVVVTLEMDAKAPIRVSTTAKISTASIVSAQYVELLDSRGSSPDLPEGSTIPSAASTMSRLLKTGETVGDELTKVLANLESWTTADRRDTFFAAVEQATRTLESIQRQVDALGPEVSETISVWKDTGSSVAEVIVRNQPEAERLLRDLAQSAEYVRTFLGNGGLDDLARTTRADLDRLATEFERDGGAVREWLAANQLMPFLERATASIERTGGGIDRLAGVIGSETRGLAQNDLAPALRDLRAATSALARVLSLLERNPRALLFGDPLPEKRLPATGTEGR